jgi:hypothetical protein
MKRRCYNGKTKKTNKKDLEEQGSGVVIIHYGFDYLDDRERLHSPDIRNYSLYSAFMACKT